MFHTPGSLKAGCCGVHVDASHEQNMKPALQSNAALLPTSGRLEPKLLQCEVDVQYSVLMAMMYVSMCMIPSSSSS